jgi:peptidyl-prolyl cis-trans isomerase C
MIQLRKQQRNIVESFIILFLVLFLGCWGRVEDEKIVARVDSAVLTRKDVKNRMAWEGLREDQEKEFVEKWVDRELLYQEAKRLGLDETDALQWELDLVEKEFLIHRLLERVYAKKIQISEEEILAYYEQNQDLFRVGEEEVKVEHLLTRERAEARLALQALQAGKEFGEVVREYSVGLFRDQGGNLGFIRREDVIPEIARIAFHLSPGRISSIIKSNHGYHIIKVTRKRPKGEIKDLSEVRGEILQRLRVIKEHSVYYDLLFQLQNKAKVYVAIPLKEEAIDADSLGNRNLEAHNEESEEE